MRRHYQKRWYHWIFRVSKSEKICTNPLRIQILQDMVYQFHPCYICTLMFKEFGGLGVGAEGMRAKKVSLCKRRTGQLPPHFTTFSSAYRFLSFACIYNPVKYEHSLKIWRLYTIRNSNYGILKTAAWQKQKWKVTQAFTIAVSACIHI